MCVTPKALRKYRERDRKRETMDGRNPKPIAHVCARPPKAKRERSRQSPTHVDGQWMQDGTDPVPTLYRAMPQASRSARSPALTAHGLHTQMIVERTEQTIRMPRRATVELMCGCSCALCLSHYTLSTTPHYCGPLSSRRTFKYAAWLAPLAQGTIHDPTGPFGQSTHSQSIHGVAPPREPFRACASDRTGVAQNTETTESI